MWAVGCATNSRLPVWFHLIISLCFSADNLWTDWSFHATHGVIWDGRKHFISSSARGLFSTRLAQNTLNVTSVHGPFLRSRFAIFLLPFIHPEIDPKRFNIKMRSRKKRKKKYMQTEKGQPREQTRNFNFYPSKNRATGERVLEGILRMLK